MLKLDLVSPSGQIMSGKEISSLIIPSSNGEINILPGHIDMVCSLGKGILSVSEMEKYVIYGGIMEVSNGSDIVVAADKIRKISELQLTEINSELKEVENKLLNEILNDADFANANSKYQDLQAELSAVKPH